MIKNFIEELNNIHPQLVEEYSNMSKDELLNQICAEVLDLLAMEKRVSLFMQECTEDMSKTNYTLESLRTLINEKQESDINEFCAYTAIDGITDEEIVEEIKSRAKEFNK